MGSDGDPTPKQYRLLAGVPVLSRTIGGLLACSGIDLVQPVIHADQGARYAALGLADERLLPAVAGGAERQASVLAGLRALAPHAPELVLIHDAARPFVDAGVVAGVIAALAEHAGALPAVGLTDTIKRSPDGRRVAGTEDRATLFAAQTPQGFGFAAILAAHERAAAAGATFTDDAAIAEWAGLDVVLTPGSTGNIKLTRPEDFARAEAMLRGDRTMETRVGSGYDVHPFTDGDHVTLGGVAIPHARGLAGHSDADVALHALSDAIYGAIGEGDIGSHFPPSDPQWRGAASVTFLSHAAGRVAARGGLIVNLDLTLICEAPRIGPHAAAMKAVIAQACGIDAARIAIKATTNEGLGFIGRREGIAAMATATILVPAEG